MLAACIHPLSLPPSNSTHLRPHLPFPSPARATAGLPKYKLLVEGYDLLRVMGTSGVKARKSRSNHIIEMAETLGAWEGRGGKGNGVVGRGCVSLP